MEFAALGIFVGVQLLFARYLLVELVTLRHQVIVLKRINPRPKAKGRVRVLRRMAK